jgi:hypothetical protein
MSRSRYLSTGMRDRCKCWPPPCVVVCGAIPVRSSLLPNELTACFSPRISHGADLAADRGSSPNPGQKDKLASLHIGIAILQVLGALLSYRIKFHAAQVRLIMMP